MDTPHTTLVLAYVLTTALDILESIVRLPLEVVEQYRAFLRWGIDSVNSLFKEHGYWVVFLGTLSENTLFVGLIVPGALVIILAGIAVEEGSMSLPQALALGVAGTIIGDTISHFLGRFGWSRFGHMPFLRDYVEKVREPILRRGTQFVLVYHFAGYTRVVGPAAAGLLKMPFAKWAPADYTGAVLWVSAYMAIGYGLGALGFTLDSTNSWFRYFELALLAIVIAWGFYLVTKTQNVWQMKPEPEAPVSSKSEQD